MIAMHESQPPLHIKNPIENNFQHQNSKTFERKICQGVDGVRKLTVKSTKNLYKQFRSEKRALRSEMSHKTHLKTNVHRYIAKTESQQRASYPHIAVGHSMFLVCIGVSGAIHKRIFDFSEEKIKKTHFHIWHDRVFTLHLSKKTKN